MSRKLSNKTVKWNKNFLYYIPDWTEEGMEFLQYSDYLRQTHELGLTHLDLVLVAVLSLAAPANHHRHAYGLF